MTHMSLAYLRPHKWGTWTLWDSGSGFHAFSEWLLGRESWNILYRDYTGTIFPYWFLVGNKEICYIVDLELLAFC